MERQTNDAERMEEIPKENLSDSASPPPSQKFTEEPVPVLVNNEKTLEEDEMAERRPVPCEDIDMTPRALKIVPERREVERTREIVLSVSFLFM